MKSTNPVYDLRCTECGAPPGDRCLTRSGTDARKPHKARRDSAALAGK